MIKRKNFLSKIRELRYSFKKSQKRTELYRKSGTTDYIHLPKSAQLHESYVRHTLKFAGLSDEEIRKFISENRC